MNLNYMMFNNTKIFKYFNIIKWTNNEIEFKEQHHVNSIIINRIKSLSHFKTKDPPISWTIYTKTEFIIFSNIL